MKLVSTPLSIKKHYGAKLKRSPHKKWNLNPFKVDRRKVKTSPNVSRDQKTSVAPTPKSMPPPKPMRTSLVNTEKAKKKKAFNMQLLTT